MKKEIKFGNNFIMRKDPKSMSMVELDAYLNTKSVIEREDKTDYSPCKNDNSYMANPFNSRQTHQINYNNSVNDNSFSTVNSFNIQKSNSKSGQEYLKSLQERIKVLTNENSEIKANFVQVSEILNKERESRHAQSQSNQQFNNSDKTHEFIEYKNKIKYLLQENKSLSICNEELKRENQILRDKCEMIEQSKHKEIEMLLKKNDQIANNKIIELNTQITQLQYQLSEISRNDADTDHCIEMNDISQLKTSKLKSNKRSSNDTSNTKGNNTHYKKVLYDPQKDNKSKQVKSLTPLRYQNPKDVNERKVHKSPYKQKMDNFETKVVKTLKKKKKKKMSLASSSSFQDSHYNPTNNNSYFTSNRSQHDYHLEKPTFNDNTGGTSPNPKFDYDLNSNKVITNTTSTIDKLVSENPPLTSTKQNQDNYYNNTTSFQMNCFSSQTQTYESEKERLNQLNQVVIRIQLLEQNIAQLKASYQTFISVLETGVTNEEEKQIRESMNRMGCTLEEKTLKLLNLKKHQQELLKKSLSAKNIF